MYCTNCGTQNSDNAKFCRGCGKPLESQEMHFQNRPSDAEAADPVNSGQQSSQSQAGYGTDPYGNWQQSSQGNQAGYGTDPYGNWQQNSQGNQAGYGTDPYGNWQQSGQGNQAGYGTDPYGNWQQSGQGNQAGYGTNPYGNWQQNGQASQPYGGYQNANPYGAAVPPYGGQKPVRKKKKGIVIGVILILLAVLIGGGIYFGIRSSSPMAPVDQFFSAVMSGNWDKAYDSIYWGKAGDEGYMSKSDFMEDVGENGGNIIGVAGSFIDLDVSLVSEGEAYVGDDGLTRKNITVELSAGVMGVNQTEEMDMVVVKSAKKFLFIPAWQIDNAAMGQIF